MKSYQIKKTEKYNQIVTVFNDTNVDNEIKLSAVEEREFLINVREKTNSYYALVQKTPGAVFDKNIGSICEMLEVCPNNSNMGLFYKLFIEYLNIILEELDELNSNNVKNDFKYAHKDIKQNDDSYNCRDMKYPQKRSEEVRGKVIQFPLNRK